MSSRTRRGSALAWSTGARRSGPRSVLRGLRATPPRHRTTPPRLDPRVPLRPYRLLGARDTAPLCSLLASPAAASERAERSEVRGTHTTGLGRPGRGRSACRRSPCPPGQAPNRRSDTARIDRRPRAPASAGSDRFGVARPRPSTGGSASGPCPTGAACGSRCLGDHDHRLLPQPARTPRPYRPYRRPVGARRLTVHRGSGSRRRRLRPCRWPLARTLCAGRSPAAALRRALDRHYSARGNHQRRRTSARPTLRGPRRPHRRPRSEPAVPDVFVGTRHDRSAARPRRATEHRSIVQPRCPARCARKSLAHRPRRSAGPPSPAPVTGPRRSADRATALAARSASSPEIHTRDRPRRCAGTRRGASTRGRSAPANRGPTTIGRPSAARSFRPAREHRSRGPLRRPRLSIRQRRPYRHPMTIAPTTAGPAASRAGNGRHGAVRRCPPRQPSRAPSRIAPHRHRTSRMKPVSSLVASAHGYTPADGGWATSANGPLSTPERTPAASRCRHLHPRHHRCAVEPTPRAGERTFEPQPDGGRLRPCPGAPVSPATDPRGATRTNHGGAGPPPPASVSGAGGFPDHAPSLPLPAPHPAPERAHRNRLRPRQRPGAHPPPVDRRSTPTRRPPSIAGRVPAIGHARSAPAERSRSASSFSQLAP